ncbi:M43 family zinc metalloprotease [Hymenobacter weizhouensis]|uniref:M43 family zinc metalloprotease n=1 Tax=Hymenobacter sp. YIM 151500-1 TaxID=2987689 RepID=UPI0022260E5A|nr:M43 family zinc metalloprotease [Hymenobacter sp. YIM 151500-1]UYZ64022.1 M43 family zinc metalloprotease [Hymenobacter sp. YIM 151500-1]
MQKKLLLYFLLSVSFVFGVSRPAAAQRPAVARGCAFDSVQQAEFRRDPAAERRYTTFLQQAAALAAAQARGQRPAPDVTVPVVVHIIHDGGSSNITDAQVLDALRVVNIDFSKNNPDTTAIIPAFQPIIADVGFRFRLAKLDPSGQCTTGITRTVSSLTQVGDEQVKQLVRWDPNRYVNIWVVERANGAGGYAYLPCTGGPSRDGIVVRHAQFGSIGTALAANLAVRTLTHELGHYFGLLHTWGPSNSAGQPGNCSLSDGVADTPPTTGSAPGQCDLSFAPCGVLSNVQNYMDYATCGGMFTNGQKALMRAALALTCRSTLVSPANLRATGTQDGYHNPACPPVPILQFASTPDVCEGGTVAFSADAYYAHADDATTSFQWSFPGGQPAVSTARQPRVQYRASGVYPVTLTVSTPSGSGTTTRSAAVLVNGPTTGETAPLRESFESATFPINDPAALLRNWRISAAGGAAGTNQTLRWERFSGAGAIVSDGQAGMVLRNWQLRENNVSTLTSPNINLAALPGPALLTFDRAYARLSVNDQSELRVTFSADCGRTWSAPLVYVAGTLSHTGLVTSTEYVPRTAEEWQPISIVVPAAFQGSSQFQVRLQMLNRGGNNVYLDNFRLTAIGTDANGITLFPNPLTDKSAIHFALASAQSTQVRITDMLGRLVVSSPVQVLGPGRHVLPLPRPARLMAGAYVVHLQLGAASYPIRVLVL